MKRPSFQFYPADWQGNSNLRRCSHEEKGIWTDVMCLLHDQEEYGVLRWPLKEIAQAVGTTLPKLKGLTTKGVLKGADAGETCAAYIYTPRSGRKDGEPVTLVPEQQGPIWYSSRMVRDEYVRTNAGASTRFKAKDAGADAKPARKPKADTERAKLRARVLEKTGGTCHHCSCQLGDRWEIDHLMPKSKGGRDTFDNMVPSCVACNQDKSDTLPDEWDSPRHSPSQREGERQGDNQGDGSSTSPSVEDTTLRSVSSSPAVPKVDVSRLPFAELPDEWRAWAATNLGWSPDIIADVWAMFRDHWLTKTGKTAMKSDWFATWRNWCRNERPKGGNHAAHQPGYRAPTKDERSRAAAARAAEAIGIVDSPGHGGT